MLDSLNILNGSMSIEFDKYNNIYTVLVDEDINSLVMDYTTIGDCFVNIVGNENFKYGENNVLINTYCDNEENTYKITVYKKYPPKEQIVFKEIEKEERPEYLKPTIISSCIFIILIIFIIIFHKKNRHI